MQNSTVVYVRLIWGMDTQKTYNIILLVMTRNVTIISQAGELNKNFTLISPTSPNHHLPVEILVAFKN